MFSMRMSQKENANRVDGKSVILGTDPLEKIEDGMTITLDPIRGLVLKGQVKI